MPTIPSGMHNIVDIDTTHCANYTSAIVYVAANGSTPGGAVACAVPTGQLVTIAGWNGSKYQTHIVNTNPTTDIFYYYWQIKLGPCT